jgi:hypothetical protein
MDTEERHPMLKGFDSMWAGVKHVAGETIKYAAYGALTFGAVAMVPTLIGGSIGAALPAFLGGGGQAVAGVASFFLPTPLLAGAGFGALFGGVKSLTSVGEAIKYAEQDEIFKKQQMAVFKERSALMQAAQQQGATMRNAETSIGGVMPNISINAGRAQNGVGLS